MDIYVAVLPCTMHAVQYLKTYKDLCCNSYHAMLCITGPHGHRLTAEVLTANYLELFMKAVHDIDAALPGVTLQQLQVITLR